ncbi:MAG: hypothetical protein M1827_007693 [Pycnora praestabilis]|nr:MAG: hypothetical protein M1827_007693 [Pycnora praestabilis]
MASELPPWNRFAVVSIAGSILSVQFIPQYTLTPSFFWTALQLYAFQVFIWAAWIVVFYPRFFSPLRHLPQPTGNNFFMGQFRRILLEPSGVPHMQWAKSIPNDGLIRYMGLLNQERVLVTGSKAMGEVLVQKNYEFIKPPQFRLSIGRILGFGLLLAEGDEHKVQRKNLMPAFHYRHIKDLYPIFWTKSRELAQALTSTIHHNVESGAADEEKRSDSSVVEVGNWTSRATLDIIGWAGLGHDFNALKDPNNELNQTYNALFTPSKAARRLGLLSLIFPSIIVRNLPVKRNGDVEAAAVTIRKTCRQLIREKRDNLEKRDQTGVDILSVAIRSGGFTDEEMVDQLMTFLAAGHETTASAMTWAVYLLCKHPEVQSRLRKEVQNELPSVDDSEASVTATELDRMSYLHAVCNEVLRVYSPVPITLRQAANDATIQGQFIPKGTRVILSPWATNTDPKLWGEDADNFNPDRWMGSGNANSGGAESNYAFLTFLHGPRSCIGQAFAKAEFACLLASMVGRFEMELADPNFVPDIKSGITARPDGGLQVRMKILRGW